MEIRDIIFSIAMVLSAFTLTYRWLGQYGLGDAVVILSAMFLVGMLASLILSMDTRLRRIESKLDTKERALRVNIKSVKDEIEEGFSSLSRKMNEGLEDISKRMYR